MDTGEWRNEHFRGDPATFHALDLPVDSAPAVWWFEVERNTLVLGSSQKQEHVDLEACARNGIEVVRRRSGGGAVLLQPGDAIWADVLLPVGHQLWTSDVTSSAWWLGEVWRATVADLGQPGAVVHRGPMVVTPWSSRVCFAGVAGGEVVADAAAGDGSFRKIVGISQRRTRAWSRFQCALYRNWRPDAHAELFLAPTPPSTWLADAISVVDASFAEARTQFMANLLS